MPKIDQDNVLHLLGEKIQPGAHQIINLISANLYTNTKVNIPMIVERAKKPGPTVLVFAGIHGDEFNGVEIVRRFVAQKINTPKIGTIISIPIINIFGFLNGERYFPDGRDLNRSFPGFKKGSLAGRFAYRFTNDVLPIADLCLDFHTGSAKRFNAPQIRLTKGSKESYKYAKIFNAPFTVYSQTISKSIRSVCVKKGIPYLIFEGGMSDDNNPKIAQHGIAGIKRVLADLGMLGEKFKPDKPAKESIFIKKARWIRANYSGLLHVKAAISDFVNKGDKIAEITDPYGSFKRKVVASNDGYILNINLSPRIFEGDALFHISTQLEDDKS